MRAEIICGPIREQACGSDCVGRISLWLRSGFHVTRRERVKPHAAVGLHLFFLHAAAFLLSIRGQVRTRLVERCDESEFRVADSWPLFGPTYSVVSLRKYVRMRVA